ncbi:unnamed protein product [Amoebophrya sp. A25]|nr:unnamed protein product [Amoebophrya sp. A25]|eukprot:GSA25T00001549001.1
MDRVNEEKQHGAEHHYKKKVFRSAKPENDDSLIDFSAHIHGNNRFHHTRTHNLNKPRNGKAPRHGYHRPEKQAAGYAKKLDVLPSEIDKQIREDTAPGFDELEQEQHLFSEEPHRLLKGSASMSSEMSSTSSSEGGSLGSLSDINGSPK